MDEPVFSLNNVAYSYPGHIAALSGVSLVIHKGEWAAIIGANGTGKSTLLAMLDALIFANKGTVLAFGNELTETSLRNPNIQRDFRTRVGFVFQNPEVQLFCPTVREDIVFGPLQLGVEHGEIRRRLDAVVEKLRIAHLLERSPHQLSIGEKKKAAIASTLIMDAEVLLLDEPTAGLDPQTTRDIIQVLSDAHSAGKTVVMATHDLHIVEEIADVVHVFDNNKTVIRSGSAEEILTDNDFLRTNNLIHIHVHRHLDVKHVHPHDHAHEHDHGHSHHRDISSFR
jgi:cobalt/nickel transport system ATP-binding protein